MLKDQIKDIQCDPNIARALADGVAAETRLFACKECDRFWWRRVPSRKQVSKCHRCHVKYDPVPHENEWGWAIYNCECGNEFSGHGQRQVGSECYRCSGIAFATEIRPPSRRRNRRSRNRHSCNAPDCDGHGDDMAGRENTGAGGGYEIIYNRSSRNHDQTAYGSSEGGVHYEARGQSQPYPHTGMGTGGSMMSVCASPESRQGKPKVIFASSKHVSTGSTVATYLDQDDLCSLDSYVTSLPVISE
ncbi:repressor of yield of DENV protein homolog [Mizuhopecten yessoensis]|uniref:repressor of yield of DENV protein homolog n=1 Tax=Mizuhopecten yessoensis TaxID=6573 RepID=UPI000B45D689|nr:repressor of yield of DENV protein homolog [Mizuhopecten yessoensis]